MARPANKRTAQDISRAGRPMTAVLAPERVVAIRDTREQVGVDLAPLTVQPGTLATGDYSVRGLEHVVAIELKGSIEDLLCCVGRERERFDREVQRLLAYETRALVVCTTWPEIEAAQWRGRLTSKQVEAALVGWIARGLPVCLCGTCERAGRLIARILYTAARRRYRECRGLLLESARRVDRDISTGSSRADRT